MAHRHSAQRPGGRRYTLKLSRDPRFPEVPSNPDFPSCPCAIAGATFVAGSSFRAHLISHRVRHMLRPSGTPHGRDFTRFHARPGHADISFRAPFHGRPTSLPSLFRCTLNGLGRSRGVSPPGAQRGRTSPIRGMRLQRLLSMGLAIPCLPDWRSGVALRPVWLQVAACPLRSRNVVSRTPWADRPGLRARRLRAAATLSATMSSLPYSRSLARQT